MLQIKIGELDSLKVGDSIIVQGVVRNIQAIKNSGKVFISDRTGSTGIAVWRPKDTVDKQFPLGSLVEIEGTISEYNGSNQIDFKSYKLLEESEELRKMLDENEGKGVTEEQKAFFHKVIDKAFVDQRYRRFAEIGYGLGEVPKGIDEAEYRARFDRILKGWASTKYHDNYEGGLFNHICGLLRIALSMKSIYSNPSPKGRLESHSNLNFDMLYLLCLYHDYAKPDEYISDKHSCKYNKNKLVNHIVEGTIYVSIFNKEIESHNKLTNEELEELKRAILCHHGKYEDNSRYQPESPLERLFHSIDVADSAMVDSLVM